MAIRYPILHIDTSLIKNYLFHIDCKYNKIRPNNALFC